MEGGTEGGREEERRTEREGRRAGGRQSGTWEVPGAADAKHREGEILLQGATGRALMVRGEARLL